MNCFLQFLANQKHSKLRNLAQNNTILKYRDTIMQYLSVPEQLTVSDRTQARNYSPGTLIAEQMTFHAITLEQDLVNFNK